MLPSLVALDIQEGLRQFLITGYEPSDGFFRGLMSRFVEDGSRWLKGPYLQVGLPFRTGSTGKSFFAPSFSVPHNSYVHQESAWERIASNRKAAHTLVATGTGSGKTECFLYPVLDHCARARQDGHHGIKALLVYPMNALATDQARRFAQTIHRTPFFKGLRVGLFVGGNSGEPGTGMVMGPETVITDRATLRQNPPDILLTNYKMLDYLLVRPKDRQLWRENQPETLRYIVVDELHTFDGAQGTDLALLLRRLRARLRTPENHLICVGTSATLGSSADTAPLREYARQIFAAPFAEDAVITESRCSPAEFLGDAPIEYVLQARPDMVERLRPEEYASPEEAVTAWFTLFFPDSPGPADVADPAWRVQLGEMLKRHLLFVNLLKLLRGNVGDYAQLAQRIQGPLPEAVRPHTREVLDALLVLVAWARNPESPNLPLVTLRLQVWIRELRRMVAKLAASPDQVELRPEAELKAHRDGIYLPLIQCTECLNTGWLARLPAGSTRLRSDLDEIYNTWFRGQLEIARFYPVRYTQPQVDGKDAFVCTTCANVQFEAGKCKGCGASELVPVFLVDGQHSSQRGGHNTLWHDKRCPACGADDRQLLVGSRSATLGAQVIEQIWASPYNDDKKLIAFSDSVQDAAHRAGFFGARTYLNNVRTAMTKAIRALANPSIGWPDFLEQLPRLFRDEASPFAMPEERFVVEFLGPDMAWQRDWAEELMGNGVLPKGSKLPGRVEKRLAWQAFAEFTYWNRGRHLEKAGVATVCPNPETLKTISATLCGVLHERFDLRHVTPERVFHWIWGFLHHLRRRGAILHPEMATYVLDGKIYAFREARGRKEWLPSIGERTPRPVFLTLGQHPEFDRVTTTGRKSWYAVWAQALLAGASLWPKGMEEPLYQEAIEQLAAAGVLGKVFSAKGEVIGLNPAALTLHSDVVQLVSSQGKYRLTVPQSVAADLRGLHCLQEPKERYEEVASVEGWLATNFARRDIRRVIPAEHTGLLERTQREGIEIRFKADEPKPWYENLLSATPTLEMGVDIGDLSTVMLCSVPPNQASFLQRMGRAGRRDGNAVAATLAEGNSPHDLYFFHQTEEMLNGDVSPPGIFLRAAEVLRRQLFAFCLDAWVASGIAVGALPEKTSVALDSFDNGNETRFPFTFSDFILKNEPRLLEEFQDLLGDDIDQGVRDRLRDAMQGTPEVDGIRQRLSKVLEDLSIERKQNKKRAEQLKNRIAGLRAKPQDEATRHEIEQLNLERDKALELIKEINSRDLLNTFTDAGLIPNYAFPEAGVELKSVVWRQAGSDDKPGARYITSGTLRYERPAGSALSEFAPENRFYANQRRVEIDQINMTLSKLEKWRLCPNCSHMENLEVAGDAHLSCPNCESPAWREVGQIRNLLRFRQAISNANDIESRIDDSAEDREPRYYVRQLLAEFGRKHVKEAYRLKNTQLPFGFEFISRASFRDVNFGEMTKQGDNFSVAGKESTRPGFKLCRSCGKVQQPPRKKAQNHGQDHAFDCEKRDSDDPENLVECLYLYREFHSEALRILVPYTRSGVDESVIQSFMAAIQLGLKLRFGGRVDHLRFQPQDEPSRDSDVRRQYVLIYDSVPGGTGYLHQLLANDAATMREVILLARRALHECPCNKDPEKDGCYRCLYQYRLGRKMDLVSRDKAKEVLDELVNSLDQLEKVETIADIYLDPKLDSELERNFLKGLQKLSKQAGLPMIRLVQEVIKGKSGYLLEVGNQKYWLEPQVDLGPEDGIVNASRPDFVIRPVKSSSARKPIAVFCDGWSYHRDKVREDAVKRNAIVLSGRYWVWSLTHEDVKASLEGQTLAGLDSHFGEVAVGKPLEPRARAFAENSMAQLVRLLEREENSEGDPALSELRKNAAWATFLMVENPQNQSEIAALAADFKRIWKQLPDWMGDKPKNAAFAGSRDGATPQVRVYWPQSFLKGEWKVTQTPGVLVLNDKKELLEKDGQTQWRRWLWIFNTLQSLPGTILATEKGLEQRDYDALPKPAAPAKPPASVASPSDWEKVLNETLESVRDELHAFVEAGLAPPDQVGYEHADDTGNVSAEAELAWVSAKVVLLVGGQDEYSEVWKSLGWKPVIADGEWPGALISELQSSQKVEA
jgi:DEAD/DEAH box helicase domain-containing protein